MGCQRNLVKKTRFGWIVFRRKRDKEGGALSADYADFADGEGEEGGGFDKTIDNRTMGVTSTRGCCRASGRSAGAEKIVLLSIVLSQ